MKHRFHKDVQILFESYFDGDKCLTKHKNGICITGFLDLNSSPSVLFRILGDGQNNTEKNDF
jgi:hypothetical protein